MLDSHWSGNPVRCDQRWALLVPAEGIDPNESAKAGSSTRTHACLGSFEVLARLGIHRDLVSILDERRNHDGHAIVQLGMLEHV